MTINKNIYHNIIIINKYVIIKYVIINVIIKNLLTINRKKLISILKSGKK